VRHECAVALIDDCTRTFLERCGRECRISRYRVNGNLRYGASVAVGGCDRDAAAIGRGCRAQQRGDDERPETEAPMKADSRSSVNAVE
jgi:hypothetical protein